MFPTFILFFVLFDFISARPPEIVPFGAPVLNIEQNESFLMTCNIAKGTKPIHFEWFRNGVKLVPEHGLSLDYKSSSSSLTIDDTRIEHSGNYSCRASNSDGFDQSSTFLQVKGLFLDSFPFGGAKNAEIFVEYFCFSC